MKTESAVRGAATKKYNTAKKRRNKHESEIRVEDDNDYGLLGVFDRFDRM
jgi:hypothetical protein